MVRAPACHAGGRGFEPRLSRHFPDYHSWIVKAPRVKCNAALSLALTQCGQVNTLVNGFKYANAVASALEQEMGAKPQVGFNWHNGRLLSVTVQFPDLYQRKPLAELAGRVRAVVEKEFQQKPDNIILGFRIDG